MQFSTISPAPRCCASTIQSSVRRANARVRDGSPVYWRTRHSPSASRRLSIPTTTHCTPNASASSSINVGRSSAGVFTETLSAPACNTPRASSTVRMPPATQNGMSISRATRSIHARSTLRPSGLAVMS
jgi:hypothetical protein